MVHEGKPEILGVEIPILRVSRDSAVENVGKWSTFALWQRFIVPPDPRVLTIRLWLDATPN
jgi:hypothetical protein